MSVPYFGDFDEDETVYIPFNTFSSDDPSASATITNLADADIKVHKDGGVTPIATDGATIAIDFPSAGVTGNHLVTIDTSVHADYATGSDYHVRIEGTTVDGATVNAWIGAFSIENRSALRPTTAGRTLEVDTDGYASADLQEIQGDATAPANMLTVFNADYATNYGGNRWKVDLDTIKTRSVSCAAGVTVGVYVGGGTDIYADWANGGRLDLIVDNILQYIGEPADLGNGQTVAANLEDIAGTGFITDTHSLVQCITASGFATEAALADGTVQVGTVQDGAIGAAAVADIFSTTALTEAYAADGAAATVAQLLYMIQQSLHEFAISGTTRTVKKLDGSAPAATFTLDDADTPSSTTRAS